MRDAICYFCWQPVTVEAPDTFIKVEGWVKSEGKDGFTLRNYLDHYAHGQCVRDILSGNHPSNKLNFEPRKPDLQVVPPCDEDVDSMVGDDEGEDIPSPFGGNE